MFLLSKIGKNTESDSINLYILNSLTDSMLPQIPNQLLQQIHEKIDNDEISIEGHAQKDIMKQGYRSIWNKEFIKECLKKGKIYNGKTLYPNKSKRHDRYYCIHKYLSTFFISYKLVLISFIIRENILIIHISPLNKHSKEGKIYYNL